MHSIYFTKAFLLATLERSIKTFAQTLVAVLGVGFLDILKTDWVQSLSVAAGAAVLSILTSVASAEIGKMGGPSLTTETIVED